MKKSVYKVIAEAIAFNKLEEVDLPTGRVDNRRMTVDEIKECIMEEFGKVKKASDVEKKELEAGWGDAEIANEIEWVKKLNIKEFFEKKKNK